MSLLEPRNPTTVDSEKYNLVEISDKNLKIPVMRMIEILKEEMKKSLNIYENANKKWKEINKSSSRPEGGNRINKENSN